MSDPFCDSYPHVICYDNAPTTALPPALHHSPPFSQCPNPHRPDASPLRQRLCFRPQQASRQLTAMGRLLAGLRGVRGMRWVRAPSSCQTTASCRHAAWSLAKLPLAGGPSWWSCGRCGLPSLSARHGWCCGWSAEALLASQDSTLSPCLSPSRSFAGTWIAHGRTTGRRRPSCGTGSTCPWWPRATWRGRSLARGCFATLLPSWTRILSRDPCRFPATRPPLQPRRT